MSWWFSSPAPAPAEAAAPAPTPSDSESAAGATAVTADKLAHAGGLFSYMGDSVAAAASAAADKASGWGLTDAAKAAKDKLGEVTVPYDATAVKAAVGGAGATIADVAANPGEYFESAKRKVSDAAQEVGAVLDKKAADAKQATADYLASLLVDSAVFRAASSEMVAKMHADGFALDPALNLWKETRGARQPGVDAIRQVFWLGPHEFLLQVMTTFPPKTKDLTATLLLASPLIPDGMYSVTVSAKFCVVVGAVLLGPLGLGLAGAGLRLVGELVAKPVGAAGKYEYFLQLGIDFVADIALVGTWSFPEPAYPIACYPPENGPTLEELTLKAKDAIRNTLISITATGIEKITA